MLGKRLMLGRGMRLAGAGLAVALLALTSPASGATRHTDALSHTPVPALAAWRSYVIDSGDRGYLYPKHVYIQNGSASQVSGPGGLEAPGGAVTTINSTAAGSPQLVLDLGVNTGGNVEVGITKTDGTKVDLGYSETRRQLTATGDYDANAPPGNASRPITPDLSRSDTISATQPDPWTSPAVRGAERWISIQLEGAGSVSIDYVRVHVGHFIPSVRDYAGHFLSSDHAVNRAWYSAAYTEALDTWRGTGNWVVVDGAKRDRAVFTGDSGVSMPTNLDTFAQGAAHARDSIYIFACQQSPDGYLPAASRIDVVCPPGDPGPATYHGDPGYPIALMRLPEYTAWYVVNAATYYLYTGDAATVRAMLPSLRLAVSYLNDKAPSGLVINTPVEFNWHPIDLAAGASSFSNEVYAAALNGLADLEQEVGDGAAAAAPLRQRAAAVEAALIAQLWDPAAKAFFLNTGDTMNSHGQDGNVAGPALGIVDGQHAKQALAFVREHLWSRFGPETTDMAGDQYMAQFISPFITSIELRARMIAGDTAGALDLIRRTYAYMASADPGTAWERMNLDGAPNGGTQSFAHAWSTGAVGALSNYVLGIRPVSPGFSTWIVAPQVGDLSWAQGQVPSPHGPVASRWARGAGNRSFKLTVAAPGGTVGTVAVPELGGSRTVAEDGRVVWRAGHAVVGGFAASEQAGTVRFAGVSGTHTFAWGRR
jgi:alpha-L-rhamnosidase